MLIWLLLFGTNTCARCTYIYIYTWIFEIFQFVGLNDIIQCMKCLHVSHKRFPHFIPFYIFSPSSERKQNAEPRKKKAKRSNDEKNSHMKMNHFNVSLSLCPLFIYLLAKRLLFFCSSTFAFLALYSLVFGWSRHKNVHVSKSEGSDERANQNIFSICINMYYLEKSSFIYFLMFPWLFPTERRFSFALRNFCALVFVVSSSTAIMSLRISFRSFLGCYAWCIHIYFFWRSSIFISPSLHFSLLHRQ